MSDLAIQATNVTKSFAVHTERATSFKERIIKRRTASRRFDAVHDLSLDIQTGTTVGLIGANGSGKSTTLKVLAGILRPSSGKVVTYGRIASLLELGAGFNGELSGRENVYLNASLLGLSRKETDGLFDEILAFSELEEFIDNPVKHYSSGMYVRLGFAVAVHVDPDILLVDEVLAVGDEHFARKCLDKIAEFQQDGRTILFVTHGLDLVERICNRAVVLDHGVMRYDGDPYFATSELRRILGTDLPVHPADSTPEDEGGVTFGEVVFSETPGGPAIDRVVPGQPLTIRVVASLTDRWAKETDHVGLTIMGVGNIPIWTMRAERDQLPHVGGRWVMDFVVPQCPRVLGKFVVAVQLTTADDQPIGAHQTTHSFAVAATHSVGIVGVDYAVDIAVAEPTA